VLACRLSNRQFACGLYHLLHGRRHLLGQVQQGRLKIRTGTSRRFDLFWNGRPNPGVELEPGVYVVHAGVEA